MRVRGLKVDYKSADGKIKYCRIEILCRTEEGIVNFIELCRILKNEIQFTYIRLMGDNHEDTSASREIPVTERGFNSIMEGFAKGYFFMTNEFRIYNFKPETTPLLAYA